MQEPFELVVVDVIFELGQEPADQVADEDHLRFERALDGEEDGLEGAVNEALRCERCLDRRWEGASKERWDSHRNS